MLPDEVLHLFEDGDWHAVEEVADQFQLTTEQAESIIEVLGVGGFIEFDKRHSRAKLKISIQRILNEIRDGGRTKSFT